MQFFTSTSIKKINYSFVTLTAALIFMLSAQAAPYTTAVVSNEGSVLNIHANSISISIPRTEPTHKGFSNPRVSSDGHIVGWLELHSNCCTSYPIPLFLVIFAQDKIIQRFQEGLPIWGWSFEQNNSAVAYRQRPTHGNAMVEYKLRRVRDGKLLEHFECYSDEMLSPSVSVTAQVPAWVWSIAEECPTK
jgi:hypothetical protein